MSSDAERENDERPRLGPPKFSLRMLLAFVTLCAFLLGIWQWFGVLASLTAIFIVLSIFAHVAGNALGTRLRDGPEPKQGDRIARTEVALHEFAPTTELSRREGVNGTTIVLTLLGGILGGLGGSYAMMLIYGEKLDFAAIGLAAGAFGVFGSLTFFLSFMLVRTVYAAISQALRHR